MPLKFALPVLERTIRFDKRNESIDLVQSNIEHNVLQESHNENKARLNNFSVLLPNTFRGLRFKMPVAETAYILNVPPLKEYGYGKYKWRVPFLLDTFFCLGRMCVWEVNSEGWVEKMKHKMLPFSIKKLNKETKAVIEMWRYCPLCREWNKWKYRVEDKKKDYIR